MNRKTIIKNAVSSLLSYGVLTVVNLISSKIILETYGSEVNGLLSSVNQLYSYIALLEAGIGTATITALYQPISAGNQSRIAEVLAESRQCYRTMAKGYCACVIVVAFVWPLTIHTEIPYTVVWGVIFFQGVSGAVTYWYTSTVVQYLMASGKNYINSYIHLFATILICVLKIVICQMGRSIVFLTVASITVNILKCAVYWAYIAWKYPSFAHLSKVSKTGILKQRSSLMVHEISGVIFSSTDTLIISIFCGLKEASVYAVYSMIYNALRTIIGQVFNGTCYMLGNRYSQDSKNYPATHDRYNVFYICGVFVCFTVAYGMSLSFVSLYTREITDVNYLDPKLPMLFCLIELLSACRVVDNQLIKNSYHAKQTMSRSMIEAAINLSVSIVAVPYLGMYGVLLGTIVALLYRVNDIVLYANIRILHRSPLWEYHLYGVNGILFFLCAAFFHKVDFSIDNYFQWIGYATVVGLVVLTIYGALNAVLLKKHACSK